MEERAELDGMQVTVVEQGEQFLGKASILSSGPVHTVMNSGSSWCPFLATLLCTNPFTLHGPSISIKNLFEKVWILSAGSGRERPETKTPLISN